MSESEHPEIQGHFHNVIKPPNPKKFKDNKIKKNRQRKYFSKFTTLLFLRLNQVHILRARFLSYQKSEIILLRR